MRTLTRWWRGALAAVIISSALLLNGCAETMMGGETGTMKEKGAMQEKGMMKKEGGMMKDDKGTMEKKQ